MIRALVRWSVHNPLVVLLLVVALAAGGGFAFTAVNIEAYPDPAPAIIEVIGQYPGKSAEQVEEQVTIPLEQALAGMPGLTYTRSKSLFGLSHLRNQFDYGIDFERAKQEVLNRLANANLPPGVKPDISPTSPTGEIFRYSLRTPREADGREIYSLNDVKALEDWTLERVFGRIPRIAGVVSSGGTIKRYEIQPRPDRMQWYNVTLADLQAAVAASNQNFSGDIHVQGETAQVIRALGLIGGGRDPLQQVLTIKPPPDPDHVLTPETRDRLHARAAAKFLFEEEERRREEIRQVVIKSVDNKPVCIGTIVDADRFDDTGKLVERRGVLVGYQTRQGRVSLARPKVNPDGSEKRDARGDVEWEDRDDIVQGVVLLRKGYESLPALRDVKAKVRELNDTPGKLPAGIRIEPYYDRTDLMNLTTETVHENLLVGLALVSMILLMFLNNIRSALIAAINIPLALLFAFGVLYVRGRSANLLSIGAVDFGIIVDSTVIMVENIYRHLSSTEGRDEPLRTRLLKATGEVEKSLFFSTIIMVCALLPLFTMKGPEGQIFGPMADTYAFALGGALLLALTVSPVLCYLLFRKLKPTRDNILVRGLKGFYLGQLNLSLKFRWVALALILAFTAITMGLVLPRLGKEFMPELEEGNLWVRGTFPVSISLERVTDDSRRVRAVMEKFPEVESIVPQIGRPDDGTDPTGFYNMEIFVPLKPMKSWPVPAGKTKPRTKPELVKAMQDELEATLPGVDWDFSQVIRDNVMEALSGVKGENSIKIFGPDLDRLEKLAEDVKNAIATVPGVDNAGVFRIKGQTNIEWKIDRARCGTWGIRVDEVGNAIETAIGGKSCTQVVEGEKKFDLVLRWPERYRRPKRDRDEGGLLDIPVDVLNHSLTQGGPATAPPTPMTGPSTGLAPSGTTRPPLTISGNVNLADPTGITLARRRLGDLVSAVDEKGRPIPGSNYQRPGASTIYREQGERFIAVKFSVRGRDLASAVAEAQEKILPLVDSPYRTVWSGEFEEMEAAERRLIQWFSLSLMLIFVLLYMAFRSFLDAFVVFSNVLAASMGGIWALWLSGLNINISAAVGFISILGVAVMNGLLMVSSMNALRAYGEELGVAIRQSMAKLIRPVTMTALAAILGLLPAAFSTKIGSQSQRPLAIVVVGGMCMTLVLMNLVPLLYSFYGKREPPEGSAGMAH